MSKILSDSQAELLAGLVRDERRDVVRGSTVYPEHADVLTTLDEAEKALTGETGFTADAVDLIVELAREERRELHSGTISYGTREQNEWTAVDLTEAIEALHLVVTVTA